MNVFKNYHPLVNFTYFLLVIGFSMFLMNPLCLLISFVCPVLYSAVLEGKRGVKRCIMYAVPGVVLMAMINPLFNHEGVTVLGYLPDGNPITGESVIYGVSSAMMLCGVICWFSCYNAVMTGDKFIYLFGKIIPAFSLIISMTLRFVPLFSGRIKEVAKAQRCIGRDVSKGSVLKRARYGIKILSGMLTWSLESAAETSDSMKARGYGLPGRTTYSIFRIRKSDVLMLCCILLAGIYVFIGKITGLADFEYYPYLRYAEINLQSLSVPIVYFMLCVSPILLEIAEVRKWRATKSKI